jgi:hypothetical protein
MDNGRHLKKSMGNKLWISEQLPSGTSGVQGSMSKEKEEYERSTRIG